MNRCGKGIEFIFSNSHVRLSWRHPVFHVAAGAPVSAFSMHNNYARSAEEDCPKKQRKGRNYGALASIGSTCGTSSVRWLAFADRTNNRIRSLRFIAFR